MSFFLFFFIFFFFNDTATTEIYTLSLHDALPILNIGSTRTGFTSPCSTRSFSPTTKGSEKLRVDRKSTRLNSSHSSISYAVFCLKKKKTNTQQISKIQRQKWAK